MHIRRFSEDLKSKVPGGHPGIYTVPIQIDSSSIPPSRLDEYSKRVNGLPILLDRPLEVVAMYLEPGARMDEHSADVPILFLVTGGSGFVRLGGPEGETRAISAGDAVLWPAQLEHMVWTGNDAMQAIVLEGPAERV